MRFIWVGKTKDGRIRDLENDYLSRVRHYHPCEVSIAKPARDGPDRERLAKEGVEIRSKIKPGAYSIALDPAGSDMDSPAFSRFLGSLTNRPIKEVAFIIGGHLGIDSTVLESVDQRLSLSRRTFPHELCRVLLLEQVYRACSMRSGTPYHK